MISEARIANWVRETCLLFGTTHKTAHTITVLFLEALERDGIALLREGHAGRAAPSPADIRKDVP